MTKGPKYRLPTQIDFKTCRDQIETSLQDFSIKWCRRENADSKALDPWLKDIFRIIDIRIKFYMSNNHLLPPKPRLNFKFIKKELKHLHSKYVFVPADKASNNVIIV